MKYSNDGRINDLVHELIRKGATVEKKRFSGHHCVRFPNGHKLSIPMTPSDWRSGLNWVSHVKKAIAEGAFDVRKTTPQK